VDADELGASAVVGELVRRAGWGDHDLARLARSTRSTGKKALALLERGLAGYGIGERRVQ